MKALTAILTLTLLALANSPVPAHAVTGFARPPDPKLAERLEHKRIQFTRDELRRQNSLLEVQSARLDSPARIAADASRLGMVHARFIPVLPAQSLTAKR